MKITSALLVSLIATVSCLAEATISATQDGSPVTFSAKSETEIEKHAVALLISCDYEAPSDVATKARWKSALGGSNIHVVFTEPHKFSFAFSTTGPTKVQDVLAQEILIPISPDRSPDYILVAHGEQIRAFSKYHDRDALLALQDSLKKR